MQVLDATDDEPWGPHGTALAEIAQATKKLYLITFMSLIALIIFVFFFFEILFPVIGSIG